MQRLCRRKFSQAQQLHHDILDMSARERDKKATAIFFLMVFLFIVASINVSPWLAPFGLVSPDWWCFQDGKMERIEPGSPLLFFCL